MRERGAICDCTKIWASQTTWRCAVAKWQLQEAKNNLSKLIDRALTDGPQIITRHGVEVVVVMPVARYRKLTRPERNLADFLLHSPLRNSDLVIERDPDAGFPARPDQPV